MNAEKIITLEQTAGLFFVLVAPRGIAGLIAALHAEGPRP